MTASSDYRSSFEELSDKQRIILTYTPKASAFFSFLLCTYVSYRIYRDKTKMVFMYHRLALGMCMVSGFNSLVIFLQSWAVPSDTPGSVHALGNIFTCSAAGFLNQVGLANQYYYVSLSIYVLCALKCEFRLKEIQWIEKYIHVGAFIFPLASAIFLASVEMFNPIGMFCWINASPEGCDREEWSPCKRGSEKIGTYVLAFGVFPTVCNLILATFVIIACYINEQTKHREKLASGNLKGKMVLLESARSKKSMLIVRQGAVYLLTFYCSYIMPSIAAMVQVKTQKHQFYPLLLACIFFPMDGCFFTLGYLFLRGKSSRFSKNLINDIDKEIGHAVVNSSTGNIISKESTDGNPAIESDIPPPCNRVTASKHRKSWCVSDRAQTNMEPTGGQQRRASFSVSLFDATDEEKWKAFGVYVGSDSDSDSDSDFFNYNTNSINCHISRSKEAGP